MYAISEGRSIHLNWEEAEEEWRKERTEASAADLPLREYSEDVAARTKSFLAELIEEVRGLKRKEAPRILISSHGGCLKRPCSRARSASLTSESFRMAR